MNMPIRHLTAVGLLVLCLLSPACAADKSKEYAAALKQWRPLAEQGNAVGQFNLGEMYAKGLGVPQDDTEAMRWYRLAAEQRHAGAQYALGEIYANGQGVPQNYVLAHMWLNLAAVQGDELAVKMRDYYAYLMSPAQIAEAQKLAREWKPKKEK